MNLPYPTFTDFCDFTEALVLIAFDISSKEAKLAPSNADGANYYSMCRAKSLLLYSSSTLSCNFLS